MALDARTWLLEWVEPDVADDMLADAALLVTRKGGGARPSSVEVLDVVIDLEEGTMSDGYGTTPFALEDFVHRLGHDEVAILPKELVEGWIAFGCRAADYIEDEGCDCQSPRWAGTERLDAERCYRCTLLAEAKQLALFQRGAIAAAAKRDRESPSPICATCGRSIEPRRSDGRLDVVRPWLHAEPDDYDHSAKP